MGTEKMVVVVEVETTSEYLTAKQAKAIAMAKRQEEVEQIFPGLMNYVRQNAEAGWMKAIYKIKISYPESRSQICEQLKRLGYKADWEYCGGYTQFNIEW